MIELFLKPPLIGLPLVGDAERAARAVAQLSERCAALDNPSLTAWVGEVLQDPTGRALLDSVFSNSPFLTACALADVPFLRDLLTSGPDTAFGQVMGFLKDNLYRETQEERVMRELRIARRRVALLVALADVTGVWPLERVTQSLTDFADVALSVTIAHLMLQAAERGDLVLADPSFPEDGCGYVVLAMGKQGARELNYSSDIDLIVVYEPLQVDYRGSRSLQQLFVRLTQRLIMILQQRTADGYVFRVDLRLRPDPSSTPVAVPYAAAQSYYSRRGEDWERAAMIKARPAAGDTALGRRFLAELSPFVWRDHMDFWVIRDIQAIKRRINAQRGSGKFDFLGRNIKTGPGGIREIEFFAQTQQLIFGGKDSYLRCRRTVDALSTLAESGRIDEQVTDELTEAYKFLRQLEHRLQMVDDEQTQTLPSDDTKMLGLARFMGFQEVDEFRQLLMHHLQRVEAHYNELFEDAAGQDDGSSVWIDGSEERQFDRLRDLGFQNLPHAVEQLGLCRKAAARSRRSQQAQQLFQEFFPQAIEMISRTVDPDGTLDRFHDFLCSLTSRYSCFSALSANAKLLDLLVEILAVAPAVAEILARHPDQLQAALANDFFDVLPDRRLVRADCAEALGKSADIQQAVEQTVAWAQDQKFQVAVNVLRYTVDAGDAGLALTNIADAVVHAISRRLHHHLAESADTSGSGLVVVALGAYGRGELTLGSPLELLFLYNSNGPFHGRLARRITNALGAATARGRLWHVDLESTLWRAPGPLVSSIGAFRDYCTDGIDAGQLQALTTARAVAGSEQLVAEVENVLHAALTRRRDPAMFTEHIREVRERDGLDDAVFWQPRRRSGGLDQLEALVRLFQLRLAPEHASVLTTSLVGGLAKLGEVGAMDSSDVKDLIDAHRFLRQIENLLAIAVAAPETAPPGLMAALARVGGIADETELNSRVDEACNNIAALFDRHLLPG